MATETPDCLHVGPPLLFDDTEAMQEIEAENEHYEYACSICDCRDGCRWAENMRLYNGSLDEDEIEEDAE